MALQADALARADGLAHAFFTREGGVSKGTYGSLNGGLGSGDARAAVLENRARMAARIGVAPDALVSVHQVHSPDVVLVEAPWGADARPKADAMATDRPGIGLAILTADCGPILFADPQAGVIGAAHAGWRGALGGVVARTVAAMERLGAQRARIAAALGPTISQSAYEVGPEFVEAFCAADRDHARYFAPGLRPDRRLFDLPAFIRDRLAAEELGTIEDLGRCTYGEEALFYSYRRATHRGEPDYGRLVAAIALTSGGGAGGGG